MRLQSLQSPQLRWSSSRFRQRKCAPSQVELLENVLYSHFVEQIRTSLIAAHFAVKALQNDVWSLLIVKQRSGFTKWRHVAADWCFNSSLQDDHLAQRHFAKWAAITMTPIQNVWSLLISLYKMTPIQNDADWGINSHKSVRYSISCTKWL